VTGRGGSSRSSDVTRNKGVVAGEVSDDAITLTPRSCRGLGPRGLNGPSAAALALIAVIASGVKQSRAKSIPLDCFAPLAMTPPHATSCF